MCLSTPWMWYKFQDTTSVVMTLWGRCSMSWKPKQRQTIVCLLLLMLILFPPNTAETCWMCAGCFCGGLWSTWSGDAAPCVGAGAGAVFFVSWDARIASRCHRDNTLCGCCCGVYPIDRMTWPWLRNASARSLFRSSSMSGICSWGSAVGAEACVFPRPVETANRVPVICCC